MNVIDVVQNIFKISAFIFYLFFITKTYCRKVKFWLHFADALLSVECVLLSLSTEVNVQTNFKFCGCSNSFSACFRFKS